MRVLCRVTEVLKDKVYQHTQIKTWIRTICDNILEEVRSTLTIAVSPGQSRHPPTVNRTPHYCFILSGSQGDWKVVQDLREHRAYAKRPWIRGLQPCVRLLGSFSGRRSHPLVSLALPPAPDAGCHCWELMAHLCALHSRIYACPLVCRVMTDHVAAIIAIYGISV